jgi:hypothetical protein
MSHCSEDTGKQGELDIALQREVAKELKARKRASSKASISKPQPLKLAAKEDAFRRAWRHTAGDLTEADQRKAVHQALEVFRQLPPSSSYAQHRIRVLEKALQLLDKADRCGGGENSGLFNQAQHAGILCWVKVAPFSVSTPFSSSSLVHRPEMAWPHSPACSERSIAERSELEQLLGQLKI